MWIVLVSGILAFGLGALWVGRADNPVAANAALALGLLGVFLAVPAAVLLLFGTFP